MTQRRRALSLLELGPELDLEVVVWQKAVSHIPDDWLESCYDHATANWDWFDSHKTFTPDALAVSYSILIVEDRQRREAAQRNAARDPQSTECHYCCNTGYQAIFVRGDSGWRQAARPCSCDMAPLATRSAEPLSEPEYLRDKIGRYVRCDLLRQFGAPAQSFEGFIRVPPSAEEIAEIGRLEAEVEQLERETGCVPA